MDIKKQLELEFRLSSAIIENILSLVDAGNTIPFIARYRKEMTGGMDDQVLRELCERLSALRALDKRKGEVSALIDAQGSLTADVNEALAGAQTLAEVEDIYRPFRPKRKTRASAAREKGLEPLARRLMEQRLGNPAFLARDYITEEMDAEAALQGARDILAEEISDDAAARKALREAMTRAAILVTAAVDPKRESVYAMYYDRKEPYARVPSHRALAINRGEKEGFLKVSLETDQEALRRILHRRFVIANNPCAQAVRAASDDALDRLILPSLDRELRALLTDRAQEEAISLFSANLRALLMQPPLRGKVALGLDPAYRTGCKIAVVDQTGKVLDTTVVYPTPPQNKTQEAGRVLTGLIRRHGVQVIAIGNGTASRESEAFVRDLIAELGGEIGYVMVSEAGASVYSASKLAAEEFPQYDVSLRSAVSIARRLQDPLAELVKIDPKAIGVGQYQHDMPANRMDEALSGVVESCVNAVGVDLNTASHSLLEHVAGINAAVARNIVAFREENGAFRNRKALMDVPKLGKKAFEQCAGFLRIAGGEEALDATGIHPESYKAANALLLALGCTKEDVHNGGVHGLKDKAEAIGLKTLSDLSGVGEMTLLDILEDLQRPGRDIRDDLPHPVLRRDVRTMDDLVEGMELTGTVRNVVDFGAFVDIGVHEDGLVHVTQFPTRVRHPSKAVRIGDVVTVYVLSVDKQKKRISLTMKKPKDE